MSRHERRVETAIRRGRPASATGRGAIQVRQPSEFVPEQYDLSGLVPDEWEVRGFSELQVCLRSTLTGEIVLRGTRGAR